MLIVKWLVIPVLLGYGSYALIGPRLGDILGKKPAKPSKIVVPEPTDTSDDANQGNAHKEPDVEISAVPKSSSKHSGSKRKHKPTGSVTVDSHAYFGESRQAGEQA